MSAAHQPMNPEIPEGDNWHMLVRDQGYRMFAAGNGCAVIVEGLPTAPACGPQSQAHRHSSDFDSKYGLKFEGAAGEERLVMLTEVSRANETSRLRPNTTFIDRGRRSSPWNAVRTIQPVTSLASYVAKRAGSLVFFLVRGAKQVNSSAEARGPRLDVSAVQIGRSLGLGQLDLEALRVAGLVCELGKANLPAKDGAVGTIGPLELSSMCACHVSGCANSPAVVLEMKHYCRDHFISRCYQRLDSCADQISHRPVCDQESDQLRAFLRACAERASEMTRAPFMQDSLERARLLDIRYTASDLLRKMRRSPRVAAARPVLLKCETPGRPWQEELRTVLLSRFGAMFECEHLVRPEDWLFVERLDTGERARARMAWRSPAKAGHFSVGLEFVDTDNFWDLNWKDCVPAQLPA